MEPKLFSSRVHMPVVLLKRGFGRQTSSRWRFSQKNDWVVQLAGNSAASDKGHTGALYSEKWRSGGRSWDGTFYYGELQGIVIHEMMPSWG
jgi:hypothetical protein